MAEAETSPKSYRTLILLAILLVALAGFAFSQGFLSLPGSHAASILLINDTPEPINELVLTYPGGDLKLPRIEPGQSVGSMVYPETREFVTSISFRLADGQSIERSVSARVIGDELIQLLILPVLESRTIKTEDGEEVEILQASDSKARFVVSYSGELNLKEGGE